ncbi:sodium:solute symporter family transporter [Serinicoccus kebangsaanensis]|uniref:sodium:solute symporter family transporter n=1 Tax=Serinicoccus kebangsaanensis TaxID=2602069 RepID=UPI0020C80E22|nr:hypothetical protein [Serinicoccus kebangsaanensis]
MTVPVALLGSAAVVLMPDIAPDTAILSLAGEGYLPVVIGGLLLGGALAFIITTGSSFLLSGAGNVVYDVVQRMLGRDLGEQGRLRVHRLAVLGIAAIAYVLGRFFPTVLELQLYSYTVYGVALAPPVLAIFFWPRATRWGALASMTLAVVVTITWEQLGRPGDVHSVLVSLPLTLLTLVVVSLLTPGSRDDDLDRVDAAPGSAEGGAR